MGGLIFTGGVQMIEVAIENIKNYVGKEVSIKGWLANKRSSGKIIFLQLRDGSGFIQGVAVRNEVGEEVFELCKSLTIESSVIVSGIVRADERSESGYELTVTNAVLVNIAQEYPITKKEHGPEFLMDYRHLWLRSKSQFAILRIRAEITKACRDFLDNRGFTLIESPIITPATCEGTSNLFEIDYFGRSAYLSQTGQLYAEASAMAFGKVYTFGPTFRAEKSKTRRHLNEFWMLEPEAAYYDHEANLKLQEDMIEYVIGKVLENRQYELKLLGRDTADLEKVKAPFARMTYTEAIKMLQDNGEAIEWGDDFGAPHEIYLSQQFEGKPVFVTNYPKQCKAFYMEPDPEDPRTVKCADLLYPGFGEIIGGSERIHDLDLLLQRIKEENLPEEVYNWYIDLRRYGSVPHSGFGLGIERLVTVVCAIDHVREAVPFARTLTRVTP
jgi:asparaginyl-tRNA synthetase